MRAEKINLRQFRYNLTQLKDFLKVGQIYEVMDRGKTLAYFIPSDYDISVNKKVQNEKDYKGILTKAIGCVSTKK